METALDRPARPVGVGADNAPAPPHVGEMNDLIPYLLGGALGAVLLVLLTGVLSFAKGGPWYQRNATRLMNLRVGTQFLAVLLLAALVFLAR